MCRPQASVSSPLTHAGLSRAPFSPKGGRRGPAAVAQAPAEAEGTLEAGGGAGTCAGALGHCQRHSRAPRGAHARLPLRVWGRRKGGREGPRGASAGPPGARGLHMGGSQRGSASPLDTGGPGPWSPCLALTRRAGKWTASEPGDGGGSPPGAWRWWGEPSRPHPLCLPRQRWHRPGPVGFAARAQPLCRGREPRGRWDPAGCTPSVAAPPWTCGQLPVATARGFSSSSPSPHSNQDAASRMQR